MVESFFKANYIMLEDEISVELVSEALYRGLKEYSSDAVTRTSSIGYFSKNTLGIIQALSTDALMQLLKVNFGITWEQIRKFVSQINAKTAREVLQQSYNFYNIQFPYKEYLEFIGCGLTENAKQRLGIEEHGKMYLPVDLLRSRYKEIYQEVTLAVNTYYAIDAVADELAVPEVEARQKILYIINKSYTKGVFSEYYNIILGGTQSVPTQSTCKVIRKHLVVEREV